MQNRRREDYFNDIQNLTLTVVGMGYIGLPTSTLFASAGFRVKGFDIDEKAIARLREGRITIVEPHLQDLFSLVLRKRALEPTAELEHSDLFIICVPTPFSVKEDGSKVADLSYVEKAARMIGPFLKERNIVVLESTVSPGTTSDLLAPVLEETSGLMCGRDFFVAHCPERVLPGNMLAELRKNDRIIGAGDETTGRILKDIYGRIVTEGQIFVTDEKTAELCKLVENTYRDVNIAFANELSMICQDMNIDIWELISLANRHPRVNIMRPGPGVGGHCLAVDPWFIVERCPKTAGLIRMARETNEAKPDWVIAQVEREVARNFPEGKPIKVGVLGLAYKPDIDDLRESPALHIAQRLHEKGYYVLGCEPNVEAVEHAGIPLVPLAEIVEEADFLVYAVAHTRFREAHALINSKPCFDAVGVLSK